MAGFDHHANHSPDEPPEPTSSRAARYGQFLFIGYALLYAGFMWLNAFQPDAMQRTPLGGINLAVLYGLALIVAAFVLALFYDWMCRTLARRGRKNDEVRS